VVAARDAVDEEVGLDAAGALDATVGDRLKQLQVAARQAGGDVVDQARSDGASMCSVDLPAR